MARVRHLTRAPITEALIDIRAILPTSFSPTSLLEASALVGADYPNLDEQQASETKLEMKHGSPASASTRHLGLHGVLLKSADEKSIVQFRVDGFTFNRLRPYTSWEEILPEALRLWDIYQELVSPVGIPRIAVRYINHLPLSPQAPDLANFVLTGPRLPEELPNKYNAYSSRIVLEDEEHGMGAIVIQSLEIGVRNQLHTLLLDIDAFRLGKLPGDRESLGKLFAELRAYKNQIFFGSLRDDFAATFE